MTNEYRAVVLIGPPGSGKGTQGRILGAVPGYWFVSMGEVLRSLDPHREPGRRIAPLLKRGDLVPAPLIVDAWQRHLNQLCERGFNPGDHVLVLDGLPRNVQQAELLHEKINILRVVHLFCEDTSILRDRIRRRDAGRKDDMDDGVIRHRFDVYQEQTKPLLQWYPAELTTEVDATLSPIEVLGRIVSDLASHQAAVPS